MDPKFFRKYQDLLAEDIVPEDSHHPSHLYDQSEDAEIAQLLEEVEQYLEHWREAAYQIGGTFRGPGYWAQIQKLLKNAK